MVSRLPLRFPLMALGMVALLTGLWAGLLRLGWDLPIVRPTLPVNHGPLMVSGFLGTLIGLERAVALGRRWAYAVPLLTGLGALALITGLPGLPGPLLMSLGSLGLVAVFVVIVRLQPALFTLTIGLGTLSWLIGNVLWLSGWPIFSVFPWWVGFPVLTIAGERLELGRLLHLSRGSRVVFLIAVGLFLAGSVLAEVAFDMGVRLSGLGLMALTLWLLRHDIARRTVQQVGLTRFIAVCLLSGYVWLGVGGLLALLYGGVIAGPRYDAMLHALFLGFVFAMIFGHAPIIFPAVLGLAVPFRPAFYAHLALLHLSLVLRVVGDLAAWWPGRQWGGLLNVAAVLLFLGNTVRSVRQGLSISAYSTMNGHASARESDVEPRRYIGAAGEHNPHADLVRLARLPIYFFTAAIAFFGLGVAAAPWVVGDLVDFFYQPRILALVHTFALGWITAVIMGVMYRYVPALTKQPLQFPRLALWQFWLFVIGVFGMVAHFIIGRWPATWLAAGVVVLSVVFFAANMVICLAPVRGRGVAETGMLLAVSFLLAAAVVGWLLALDKTFNFLGGSVLTNVAGHAHLAALGWVSLTICAVSYRMMPAFLLPEVELPRAARWQLLSLALATAGLGAALFGLIGGTLVWSTAVVLALLSYFAIFGNLVRSRRLPLDWTVRHAMAGVACLVLSAGLGLTLVGLDPGSAFGNRVVGAYGVLGLFGWVTNFIFGMSYQLLPGFIDRVRATTGWPRLATAEWSLPRSRPFVFFSLNAGVLVLASGLIAAQVELARLGAIVLAAGGLAYVAVMSWTLSYAYRRSLPRAGSDPLRVLPGDALTGKGSSLEI